MSINLEEKIIKLTKQRYENKNKYSTYNPYPHDRPGPNKHHQKQELKPGKQMPFILIDIILRPFNYAAQTVVDINKIDWFSIKAIELSENSSQGVTFVETDDGALVIKAIQDCSQDVFIHKLCLTLQIPVPQMRLINYQEKEFQTLITQVERATLCDEVLNYRIKPRIDMPYLQIMQYIPSVTIEGMGPKKAQKIFNYQSLDGRDRLIKLGMIIQFDTFINNYDRYPVIWDNDGNPNNIIFGVQTNYTTKSEEISDQNNLNLNFLDIYAIDHRTVSFDVKSDLTQKNLNKLYSKLQDFLNAVFMDLKKIMGSSIDPVYSDPELNQEKFESLREIQKFIYNYTLYELKHMDLLQIMIGIVNGCENFCQLGIDRVGTLHHQLFIDPSKDWCARWNTGLDKINLEVMADIINIYNKFRNVYKDVIHWVRDMTLHQYYVNIKEYEKALGNQVDDPNELQKQFHEQEELQNSQQVEKQEEEDNIDEPMDLLQIQDDQSKKTKLDEDIERLFGIDVQRMEQEVKEGKDIKKMYLPDKNKKK